jgi:ssDNA thymidine ADP-ribosyltransferase, DarT
MATQPIDPFGRIRDLYHFTDKSNISNIRWHGGLYSTARLRQIGGEFSAGGDEASLALDIRSGMDQYVHLCFRLKHPMAGRVKERKPSANLFYLTIDRAILYLPGVMFATGVGYANDARTVTLAEAIEQNLIDFHALYAWTNWFDPEAQAKRRAAELCEILIPDHVPVAFIRNLPNG